MSIPRILKWLFPQQVSSKLALVICLLVVVLLSVLGMGLTEISRDVLKAKVQRNLIEISKRAAREISLYVERPMELLKTSSHMIGRVHMEAWDQETILVELSIDFPMFENIASVDINGTEIATSNPSSKPFDWKKNKAFQRTMQGQEYYSEIYIGDDYLPHLQIALPYYSLGKIAGTLIAQVNLRGMWDIVDGVKVGQTGRAFVVTKKGILTAHQNKNIVLKNINMLSHDETLRQLIQGALESAEYPFQQKSYVAAKAEVPGPLSLVTVVQQESQEAYRFLNQMRYLIWLMITFSLILCVIISFMLASWLVKPVRSLHHWSKKVSRGDFDYHVSPKSSDEIGELFIMFKRMSERLKIAKEKEQLALIGEAAATISHKLKNITVSLKTFAQLFPERKADPVFMSKFEKAYMLNVEYLEKVLKNLSSVASDSEKTAKMEIVKVGNLLTSILEQYTETMQRSNISCKVSIPKEPISIRGDQEQLREVFVNFVQNAMQAMPRGGSLEIKAEHQKKSNQVKLKFIDSGCGMTPEQLKKVFKPFYTTKHGGMGLGLAISKKVIQLHNGEIQIHSTLGKQTIIEVYFPALQVSPSAINDSVLV